MKFDHIGIACRQLSDGVKFFENIGYQVENQVSDKLLGVDLIFLTNGGPRLELVSPMSGNKYLDNYLKQSALRPYHFAYQTQDLEQEQYNFKSNKFVQVRKTENALAFNGNRICFMMDSNQFLVELIGISNA